MNIATVAAVFVVAFLLYDRMYLVEDVQWIEKRVEHGEIVSLLLPDGSHLYMNSGSRVTYPERFEGKTRQIFVDGEIYADIAKDPEHPFVINSGDVSVDVLGTTFNMKSFSDAECVEVILLEGSVRFNVLEDTYRNEMVMRPGNMLQYHRSSGKIDLDVFPKDKYSAFYKNRSLHFFNITLEDIAEDLERLFCTKIVILNEDLAKKKYFACFGNNESLDEILNAINADKKIKIRKKEGVIYLK
jgi:ferric-dicitrate binding protein FerR (iron transport regulator)